MTDCREINGQACALIHVQGIHVAVWVFYPESNNWAKGTRPLSEWEKASPIEPPGEVPCLS